MYSAGELLRQDRAGQNLDALSYHISAWLNSCGSMSTTIHSDSLNAYSCKKNPCRFHIFATGTNPGLKWDGGLFTTFSTNVQMLFVKIYRLLTFFLG